MHSIAEIVLPPNTVDIKAAVDQVMRSFCDTDEDDKPTNQCDWWDYYQIGGRWSGNKIKAQFDKDSIDSFFKELTDRKVTVSALRAGKPELQPASQIPMVDELWRERFPGFGNQCLFFAHSGNSGDILDGNICSVGELPESLECERLIIAKLHWEDNTKLEASDMLQTEFWNKCRHHKTDFDGNVKGGIERLNTAATGDIKGTETSDGYRDDEGRRVKRIEHLRGKVIGDDWIVVTVDYHN